MSQKPISGEPIPELKQPEIEELQKLIQYNIDSREGYLHAAQKVADEHLRTLFTELSMERDQYISELQAFLITNDQQPTESGSYLARVHRTWIDIRKMVSFNDTQALLKEILRGETYLVQMYQTMLAAQHHERLDEVLQRHYGRLHQTLEKITNLQETGSTSS